MEGYKLMFDRTIVTVWSAPNYCYRCVSLSSYLSLRSARASYFQKSRCDLRIPIIPIPVENATLREIRPRCGNVASILELDEWLGQEYKVFTHAPPVSPRDLLYLECSKGFTDSGTSLPPLADPSRMFVPFLLNGRQLIISCNLCNTASIVVFPLRVINTMRPPVVDHILFVVASWEVALATPLGGIGKSGPFRNVSLSYLIQHVIARIQLTS